MESEYTEILVKTDVPTGHKVVTEKFVDAILNGGGELTAHGTEGINGLTIGNAIMLSSFNKKMIELPFDADEYENKLKELVKTSRFVKSAPKEVKAAMSQSFNQA